MRSIKRAFLGPLIESISKREEEVRLRIGLMHVSQNRSHDFKPKNLWDAEVKVFSQWGEDGILDYLFERLGIHKPKILELGAGCFAECNSRFAAHARNASVYAVDARKDLKEGITESGLVWRNTLGFESAEISDANALSIQSRAYAFMSGIDAISIDLDGNDYWIAQEMDFSDVKVVCVEYNPLFGSKRVTVNNSMESRWQRHQSGLVFGASLKAWLEFFRSREFSFVGSNRAGNNAFFVRNSLCGNLGIELPASNELDKFLDWRCRESRDEQNQLSFLSLAEAKTLIQDCGVFDIKRGQSSRLRDVEDD